MKLPTSTSMLDEPSPFDTLEAWEQFLTDSILMPQTILYAKTMIALKKEEFELELDLMSGKLPFGGALIDPPGPFDTLATWGQFLAGMESMSRLVYQARDRLARQASNSDEEAGEVRGVGGDQLRLAFLSKPTLARLQQCAIGG